MPMSVDPRRRSATGRAARADRRTGRTPCRFRQGYHQVHPRGALLAESDPGFGRGGEGDALRRELGDVLRQAGESRNGIVAVVEREAEHTLDQTVLLESASAIQIKLSDRGQPQIYAWKPSPVRRANHSNWPASPALAFTGVLKRSTQPGPAEVASHPDAGRSALTDGKQKCS